MKRADYNQISAMRFNTMTVAGMLLRRVLFLLMLVLTIGTFAACGTDGKTATPDADHPAGDSAHAEGEEHKEGETHAEGEEHTDEGGEIKLLPAAMKEAGIVVEEVKKQQVTAS